MSASPLRIIAYGDGFNADFGCLRRLPRRRWLDVAALVGRLCREYDSSSQRQ